MRCWKRFNEIVTVEPTIFLFFIILSTTIVTWQQTLYIKFCYQEYRNLSECMNGTWDEIHPALQEKTSTWVIYSNLVTFAPVIIVISLLSGYSDRHGLQLALVLPFIGGIISGICTILQVINLDWNPVLLLISGFVTGCCGYYTTVVMACMTYIARDPLVTNVALRMAVLEALLTAGTAIGAVMPGPILDRPHGLIIVWAICIALNILVLADIMLRLRHLPPPSPPTSEQPVPRSCCNLDTARSYYYTITQKRKNNRRLHLYVVSVATIISYCALAGTVDIQFLYLTKQFGKTNTDYSFWSSLAGASTFVGNTVLGYVFTAIYPLSDITFCVIGGAANAIALGMLSYAEYSAFYWLSAICRMFTSYQSLGGRLYVTHTVNQGEEAAGMGYYATLQTIGTIVASVIFNFSYPRTLSYWSGLCFNAAGWLTAITVPMLTVIRWNDIKLGNERKSTD